MLHHRSHRRGPTQRALLDLSTTRVQRARVPALEEDDGRVDG